jgi:hypothetical protein
LKAFPFKVIIRFGWEYSFQDVIAIFQTIPANNSTVRVNGGNDAEKTAASKVA